MADLTVSLPEPMKAWIEAEARKADYASASDFVQDLVNRERERRGREMTLEDLRQLVSDARSGGVSDRTIADVIADGDAIARKRGALRE